MPSLGDMPRELARMIFKNLPPSDLASVALTCHGLHALAEPILYHTVRLDLTKPYALYATKGAGEPRWNALVNLFIYCPYNRHPGQVQVHFRRFTQLFQGQKLEVLLLEEGSELDHKSYDFLRNTLLYLPMLRKVGLPPMHDDGRSFHCPVYVSASLKRAGNAPLDFIALSNTQEHSIHELIMQVDEVTALHMIGNNIHPKFLDQFGLGKQKVSKLTALRLRDAPLEDLAQQISKNLNVELLKELQLAKCTDVGPFLTGLATFASRLRLETFVLRGLESIEAIGGTVYEDGTADLGPIVDILASFSGLINFAFDVEEEEEVVPNDLQKMLQRHSPTLKALCFKIWPWCLPEETVADIRAFAPNIEVLALYASTGNMAMFKEHLRILTMYINNSAVQHLALGRTGMREEDEEGVEREVTIFWNRTGKLKSLDLSIPKGFGQRSDASTPRGVWLTLGEECPINNWANEFVKELEEL